MSSPEHERLLTLYDESHGIDTVDIQSAPLASSADGRRSAWTRIWRDLQFNADEPHGSSRLMHVAMALSASGGSPVEMLFALFKVVDTAAPVSRAYEFFLKELWISAIVNRDRFAAAFDFQRPVPEQLTPRQAYLVVRFLWDRTLYDPRDIERLQQALADQNLEALTPAILDED